MLNIRETKSPLTGTNSPQQLVVCCFKWEATDFPRRISVHTHLNAVREEVEVISNAVVAKSHGGEPIG